MRSSSLDKIYIFFISLTVLALPFYVVRFSIGPVPTTALELMIYTTFILGLIFRKIKFKPSIYFWSALFFVLAALVSIFFDPQVIRAAGIWKAYFLDGFLIYLIISSLDKSQKTRVFIALCIAGAITAALALVYFLNGVRSQDGRLLDLDQLSPNYLSMFLVPCFIGSSFLAIHYFKDRAKLIFFLFCSLIIVVALLLSGSRGVYLSLPTGFLLMLLSFAEKSKRKIYATYIGVGCALIILTGLFIFRPSFGDMGRTGSSSNIRYYIWTTSTEIIARKPISGVGLSNFQDYFTNLTRGRVNYTEYIAPQALTAHNLYLHIYLTMGLLGIVSFALLLFAFLKKTGNIVIISVIFSILVYGIVDTPFFRNDLSVLFWILLGLL